MSNPQIPTILVSAEHLIRCTVRTRGLRILDILNDPQTRYLDVADIEVYRRAAVTPIRTAEVGVVNKEGLILAIPASRQHEAPNKRAYAYTAKPVFDAFVVAGGYEIRGKFQNDLTDDVSSLLAHTMGQFLPFPDASISYGSCDDGQPSTQVALVNSSFITLMQIEQPQDRSENLAAAIREIMASSRAAEPTDVAETTEQVSDQ